MKEQLLELVEVPKPLTSQFHLSIRGSDNDPDEAFIPFTTLNEASALYRRFCDQNGFGSSQAGKATIYQGVKPVAHVSYNGKVWEGTSYKADAEPIFDPYNPKAA